MTRTASESTTVHYGKGWKFKVDRGSETAILKTKKGKYQLKCTHYNPKKFSGVCNGRNVQVLLLATGGASLNYEGVK